MKAPYSKPHFYLERFTLSQSIASSCDTNSNVAQCGPNQSDKNSCGYVINGVSYWLENMGETICFMGMSENDEIGGFCYDNPSNGFTIFAS